MALYQPYTGYVAPPDGPPAQTSAPAIPQFTPPQAPDVMHGAPQSYGVPDAHNPAAQQFALQRLHQLVAAHLLGGMPQNMADPAAVWRGLSQGLGGNAQALAAFLAAGHQAQAPHPAAQAPGLVSENGYQRPSVGQAPQLVSENGRVNAVVNHLAHTYLGRH